MFRLLVKEIAKEESMRRLTAADYRFDSLLDEHMGGTHALEAGRTTMVGPFQVSFDLQREDMKYQHWIYATESLYRKAGGWLSSSKEWLYVRLSLAKKAVLMA